jgi:hypothetical protein
MYLQVFRMKRKGAVETPAGKGRLHLNKGYLNAAKTGAGLGGNTVGLPKSLRVCKEFTIEGNLKNTCNPTELLRKSYGTPTERYRSISI